MSTCIVGNQYHGIREGQRQWVRVCNIPNRKWLNCSTTSSSGGGALLGGGGKMVVELVEAFKQLTHTQTMSSSSEALLFAALKLSIPLLRGLPLLPGGRSPLSRALSVSLLLADIHPDAELISAALVRLANTSLTRIRARLGAPTAHLLHDSLRLSKALSSHLDLHDDTASADLRRFCLTFYDARAVVLEVALTHDAMTHNLRHLPRFEQHVVSLRAMKIHAPLAHALGLGLSLSLQLEDIAFRCLFPYSYLYLDTWLRSHNVGPALMDSYKDRILGALKADPWLSATVSDVSVAGRYKSRYSTMKKLLKDGRTLEKVNDVLGLRIVLHTTTATGDRTCYRARDILRSLWKQVSHRSKDYIANPKPNGYRSLHVFVDVSEPGRAVPLMEIQIRTAEMDELAVGGAASHSFYKAGLTDPQQAKRLKAIMMAAAELKDFSSPASDEKHGDRVFRLLDKNGDGRISIDELKEVMEELGAPGEDASDVMHLLDSNSDGSLSSDEFDCFQRRVEFMRSVEDADNHYKAMLNEKLHFALDTTSDSSTTE